jgi:hypothetical protein
VFPRRPNGGHGNHVQRAVPFEINAGRQCRARDARLTPKQPAVLVSRPARGGAFHATSYGSSLPKER